jgi:hypothetical protein
MEKQIYVYATYHNNHHHLLAADTQQYVEQAPIHITEIQNWSSHWNSRINRIWIEDTSLNLITGHCVCASWQAMPGNQQWYIYHCIFLNLQ